MNASSNIYDMHHIYELYLILMTWWFHHTDLFQNEVMPLLHGTRQLYVYMTLLYRYSLVQMGNYYYLIIEVYFMISVKNYMLSVSTRGHTHFSKKIGRMHCSYLLT